MKNATFVLKCVVLPVKTIINKCNIKWMMEDAAALTGHHWTGSMKV